MLYLLAVALIIAMLVARENRNKLKLAVELGEHGNIWHHRKMTVVYKNGTSSDVWIFEKDVAHWVADFTCYDRANAILQIRVERPRLYEDDDPFGGPARIVWGGSEMVYPVEVNNVGRS